MTPSRDSDSVVLYVRVPRALHEDVRALAKRSGLSMTLVVVGLLAQAVADAGPTGKITLEVTR